jgi:hypothetical protein
MKVGGLWKYVKGLFGHGKHKTDWIVIQEPSALKSETQVPWELKYVLSLRPSRQDMISGLLEDGYGLGLSYHKKPSEEVTRAVKRVTDLTQEGLAHHWLERLLKFGQEPIWAKEEEDDASAQGIDLKQEVQTIKRFGEGHGRLALVKFPGLTADETSLDQLHELNQEMRPIAAPSLLSMLLDEIEPMKFPLGVLLIFALVIIGPLAHLFQKTLPNLGLVVAAIAPSAFFWARDAYKTYVRSRVMWRTDHYNLWEIVALAISFILAVAVWPLYSSGQLILAGMFFAIAGMLIPVFLIIRRFVHMLRSWRKLTATGKISFDQSYRWTALGEEARGLIIRLAGLVLSWFATVWAFYFWSSILGNGWFLAVLAFWPLFLAEAMAWLDLKLERWLHTRSIRRLWRQTVILTTDAWR